MKNTLFISVLITCCMLLFTACSTEEIHDYFNEHPVFTVLYALAFAALVISLVVWLLRLIIGSALAILIFVLTFFLPFNFD